MPSKTLWTVGGIAISGLVVAGIIHAAASGIPVETAQVKKGSIREFVDERAVTRLPRTYQITMPINGRVEEIALQEGMTVEGNLTGKGDNYVARIVPGDLDLAVRQATAAVNRLQASINEGDDASVEETGFQQTKAFATSMAETVKVAWERVLSGKDNYAYYKKQLDRIEKLADTGAQSQDALDRAALDKTQASHDLQEDQLVHAATVAMQAATDLMPTMVRQYIDRKSSLTRDVLVKQKAEAEIQLEQVVLDQQRGTMYSPVDGVVLRRHVTNEGFLTAGEPLLEIGRLEDLEIEADVLSLDVVDAKIGCPVEIHGPAIGPTPAKGTVVRIFPAGFTKVSSLGVEQQRVKSSSTSTRTISRDC